MAYATYEFYKDTYRGKVISEDDFSSWLFKATCLIDDRTQNRISEVTQAVSYAACSVADLLYADNKADGKRIRSENIGSWSVSYADLDDSLAKRIQDSLQLYLGKTGLLYGGVR